MAPFLETRSIPASVTPSLAAALADPSRYRDVFAALLGGADLASFFERDFETRPVHFLRDHDEKIDGGHDNDSNALFSGIFSKSKLLQLVGDRGTVDVSINLSAVRYVGGRRETKAFSSPRVDAADLARAFDEGYTVQFFQPQRFSDELHRVNASVENALYRCVRAAWASLQ